MKFKDILKKVGASIVREAVPGGGILLDVVNDFLPEDKKLPATATGPEIESAVASLPVDKQAELMGREFDIEETQIRESHSTVRAMLEHDAKNPHSTRPRIALGCFHILATVTLLAVFIWGWGVVTNKPEIVKAVVDGWPFVLAITGTFATVLLRYFGELSREHKQKLTAANGESPRSGLGDLISAFVKR